MSRDIHFTAGPRVAIQSVGRGRRVDLRTALDSRQQGTSGVIRDQVGPVMTSADDTGIRWYAGSSPDRLCKAALGCALCSAAMARSQRQASLSEARVISVRNRSSDGRDRVGASRSVYGDGGTWMALLGSGIGQ